MAVKTQAVQRLLIYIIGGKNKMCAMITEIEKYPPYDYTKLEEIILFKGNKNNTIILSREKQYINLIKEKEKHKKYYRYDLNKKYFERINHYKTKEDKITPVKTQNITKWFKDAHIITKDLHFGRLIIFAKFNNIFSQYRSPVRFIEQLGHKTITSIEQWEALGIKIEEVEQFFGPKLVSYNQTNDIRKTIYQGEEKLGHYKLTFYGRISLAPSDFNKKLLKYIQQHYTTISSQKLNTLHTEYNNGQYPIEQKLKKIGKNPEYIGIFHYQGGYGGKEQKWAFGTSSESKRVKYNLIEAIQNYNLDLQALAKWLKKQKNKEKNDVGYLFGYGNHYNDYLNCEKELQDGKLSKMNKYPDNFRTQFHKTQQEYNTIKNKIDEKKFHQQYQQNKNYQHTGKKYQIIIPQHTTEIHQEAQQLQHCVRTYIPRIIEGQTLILFLRDKKRPKTPLITLEIKNNTLTQAYGKNDSKPKKQHLQYLKTYCKNKNIKIGCWINDLK